MKEQDVKRDRCMTSFSPNKSDWGKYDCFLKQGHDGPHGWSAGPNGVGPGVYEYEEEQDMIKASRSKSLIEFRLTDGKYDISVIRTLIRRLQTAINYLESGEDEKTF